MKYCRCCWFLTCMVGSPWWCQSYPATGQRGYTGSSSWRSPQWASWTDWQGRLQPEHHSARGRGAGSAGATLVTHHPSRSRIAYLKPNGLLLPRRHSWQVDVFDDLLTQLKVHAVRTHGELEAHRLVCFSHWTWSFFTVHKILEVKKWFLKEPQLTETLELFQKCCWAREQIELKPSSHSSRDANSRRSIGLVCRSSHVQAYLVNQREICGFDVRVKRPTFYRIIIL